MPSGSSTPASFQSSAEVECEAGDMPVNSSLEELQTEQQRRVLDTIGQVRKCGLESVLHLPQLVVCGDQSAGKSSVLEALTEIPFPRNDNLCTRFATEIHLRRADHNSVTIKVIPDSRRTSEEQTIIENFEESISDFSELPKVMKSARAVMGIKTTTNGAETPQAFSRDTLSISVEGPSRPQLTLVDIPGLIATKSRGTTAADVQLVEAITDHYINQPRTICLAVICATNDHSNQRILSKIQEIDPNGERTLGIITKPDGLPAGSGSEEKFIELAKNEDIRLVLGWHVLKNRKFEESNCTLFQRNISEQEFFTTSNFRCLPREQRGIETLRVRLSHLLFNHVKKELPNLQKDLNKALETNQDQLDLLGDSRMSASECRLYLAQLSMKYSETCKSAINGHYEGRYFRRDMDTTFALDSPSTIRRARAVVQLLNNEFSSNLCRYGHKYNTYLDDDSDELELEREVLDHQPQILALQEPQIMARQTALEWVKTAMIRNRGQELPGNFNPLIVGELFWEQASKWQGIAEALLEKVAQVCSQFLEILLKDTCPAEVYSRIWNYKIQEVLDSRKQAATTELKRLMEDVLDHNPINYNHFYTEKIKERRQNRRQNLLTECLEGAENTNTGIDRSVGTQYTAVNINEAVADYLDAYDTDMNDFGCEEALDCLFSIYHVQRMTFIANVTTQVIERHVVRGLETIFAPLVVTGMSDAEVKNIASEPLKPKQNANFSKIALQS